jgi:hypothetical protein
LREVITHFRFFFVVEKQLFRAGGKNPKPGEKGIRPTS